MPKTIEEINKKIQDGDAVVLTVNELKKLANDGEKPTVNDVDVITTGTCGVMSGTSAILHVPVADAGAFQKSKTISLNGVTGYPGPCPNEWLGSVDLIVYGTTHSSTNHGYGGGFLFKDLVSGKSVDIEVESINGDKFKSTVNLEDMGTARIIGTRMAFKNYTAFTNPDYEVANSIFHALPMGGPFKGLTFSGCGDINPLQNDPNMATIKSGAKVLINGADGLIIDNGTRSTQDKPNLMLTADMHKMDSYFMGGFKTGAGPEVYNTVAIPIPVLNQEILDACLVDNADIKLPVADIKGRHLPISVTSYADMWDNHDARPVYNKDACVDCNVCEVLDKCPTNAYTINGINFDSCYGCGLCASLCQYGAVTMDLGKVDLKLESGQSQNVPIICRQSDKLRAEKLMDILKERIIKSEFLL